MTPLLFAQHPEWPLPAIAVAPAVEYILESALLVAALWIGWRLTRALESRTRELRASEERFRDLFEHGIEGVYESTSAGGFERVNPRWRACSVTKVRPRW